MFYAQGIMLALVATILVASPLD